MLPSPRASVASAMAPVRKTANLALAEVAGIVKQRYIETEFGIPVPGKLAELFGMPSEFVIRWRINLPSQ